MIGFVKALLKLLKEAEFKSIIQHASIFTIEFHNFLINNKVIGLCNKK